MLVEFQDKSCSMTLATEQSQLWTHREREEEKDQVFGTDNYLHNQYIPKMVPLTDRHVLTARYRAKALIYPSVCANSTQTLHLNSFLLLSKALIVCN